MITQLKKDLQQVADPEKAVILQRFFKTGKGQYGEGDLFLGIKVPEQRKIAKKYATLTLRELQELLSSKYHEHRLTSLLILVIKYSESDETGKKELSDFYLKNTMHINNWDLVDVSADKILGQYLFERERKILFGLARSDNLWERRIAVMATFHFIKNNDYKDSLKISEILIADRHDLIHKAVGWLLREIGKRNLLIEEEFLKRHYKKMPRTMLRYAIEKFDHEKRRTYLNNLV
ncbi:MAG: DNA alkylation repair protein [Nitrospiraceae bacterium]|nr:MAG: DNA alkylation repair protein [Nitrospiraceae bacterium]